MAEDLVPHIMLNPRPHHMAVIGNIKVTVYFNQNHSNHQNTEADNLTRCLLQRLFHNRTRNIPYNQWAGIALPGGCGTLEELLEIITWKQLGLYLNPVVILNTNNFFDPLLAMLQHAMDENFMREQHGAIWHVASTPQEAVELIHTIPVWDSSIRKFAAI